ncbi:MAG: hypothetical protein HY909_02400 [Deltaproteobacteria bacterium]|nr:hypothetical protein [Deltaproteobacteria bacterium]
MRVHGAIVLACVALGACRIDFQRHVLPEDGGPGVDAPAADTSVATDTPVAADTSQPRDGLGADTAPPGPCTRPALLAAVENLAAGAERGGFIARYSLQDGRRCADFDGGGQFPAQPLALTWTPEGAVAVAFREEVLLLHGDTGAVLDRYPGPVESPTLLPQDVVPLALPAGPSVAVGYRGDRSEIERVRVHTRGRSGLMYEWVPRTHLLSSFNAMTRSPLDPSHLLILSTFTNNTRDLTLPVTAAVRLEPYAVLSGASGFTRVYSYGDPNRTAWTEPARAYYLRNPSGPPPFMPLGPRTLPGCGDTLCRELVQVVPDPVGDLNLLALCESGNDTVRYVVRSTSSECLVLDGRALRPGRTRIAGLAIAR